MWEHASFRTIFQHKNLNTQLVGWLVGLKLGASMYYVHPKVCYRLRDRGLLAKPTHGDIIRFDVVLSRYSDGH